MENKALTLISWNFNGIRAAGKKGFIEWMDQGRYPIVGLQETKVADPGILPDGLRHLDGYDSFWNSSVEKKGYSGVAVYTKIQPSAVKTDFGESILSKEGRVIELEFPEFTFLNIYFPNGGSGDVRLRYKLEFYDAFLKYVSGLVTQGRRVVFCGDVNTAHKEIDLARPKENVNTSGFMPVEREWLDRFVEAGFVDTFRMFHPDKAECYTWWDMKTRARQRNVGWRIDYFFVSENMRDQVKDAFILPDVLGSDHCPVGITVEV
jgi:exodeoxyribonuclease-3